MSVCVDLGDPRLLLCQPESGLSLGDLLSSEGGCRLVLGRLGRDGRLVGVGGRVILLHRLVVLVVLVMMVLLVGGG
jgi:hypothetical protein